jgi:signal transduction histidine kinase/ActR/RegA family two-component response regulator
MRGPAVRADQIRTLYNQSGPILLANVLNAAVVTATLWPTTSRVLLLSWAVAVALMTLGRIELRRRYLKARPSRTQMEPWGTRFVIGSLLGGSLWGIAGVLFFDPNNALAQILITFSIGGMAAGAAGTLSPHLPAFFAYMLPAVVPLFVRVAAIGDPLHIAMAAMIAVFVGGLTVVARNTNRAVFEVFRLHYENEALLGRLAGAQVTLQQANRTLEEKVVERTSALERQGEALRSAQRLEAVGRLAGGVAHDFNNLLTVVIGNASLLLDRPFPPDDRLAISEMRDAAERGANLVRQLLAFGGRQRLETTLLDLNQVLLDLKPLLSRLITEQISLHFDLSKTALHVVVDRSQVEQVVVNLVTNARDAMPGGGKLRISTKRIQGEIGGETSGDTSGEMLMLPSVAASAETMAQAPAGYAVLEVVDDGVGMDAETRRRAFEPFFTTKALGRGSGLGLATVYGIVEQSGGHIKIVSGANKGSRFVVYLPMGGSEATNPKASRTPAPASSLPAARGTILLVEDDDVVRSVAERLLSDMGHRVLVAADGIEALEIARAERNGIDVLVTDIVMAAMPGHELAERLRREQPGIGVLLMSGYSPDHVLSSSSADELYLQKPFSPAVLRDKVEAAFARRVGTMVSKSSSV